MARFTTGTTFASTQTVTAADLNDAVNNAALASGSVDDDTIELESDALRIKDGGVGFAKLKDVIDDDTMATATATTLATSESIKAYVDNNSGLKASTATGTISTSSANTFQDFDLSAVVGSNKAMVIMEVFDGTNGRTIFFRTKGSTVSPYGATVQGGSNTALLGTADGGATVIVTTDSSGFLEVLTGGQAISNVKYAVQAFQVFS